MKKLPYSFIITIIAGLSIFAATTACREYIDTIPVKNVDLNCSLNITGGCFDQWVMLNDGNDFFSMEPAGNYLRTLNYLHTLPAAAGGPGPLTTDSTTDSYSGKYAALLITGTFSPMGSPILIPGLVGTDSLDIPNANIRLGKRYTLRPTAFLGYYKYEPVAGDSAMISVVLSKYNTALNKRDTIGWVKQLYKNTVTTYTPINLPIIYNSADTPDTLTLLICSSAGVRFNDLMNCKGQVGSKMWIDEISFVLP
ncbi:MAG: PCMD domain-containing protein [Bacteroidota bacterium]